jgi:hypothetical protein
MRLLPLALALLCAAPAYASVTIGTPVQLGAGTSTANANTVQITTGANASAGSTIIIAAGATVGANAPQSVVDDAGNSYTLGTAAGSGSVKLRFAWCFYCAALPSGSHITITYATTNTNPRLAAAISVTGLNNLDLDGAGATGTGGGGAGSLATITTGTLGQASELIIAATDINTGASDTFTEASGFNSNTSALSGGALRWAYKIVSATTAVAYTPTLATSRAWSVQYETFEAKNCSLGTTGAGAC